MRPDRYAHDSLVPKRVVVIVRHGATPMDLKENLPVWIRAVADAFR